ncbi:MAG: hypothetical protein GF409_03520 [Candidatus Omnitrophica bacterium]|nr:hypothetical protein [Candidatus Omnitrophota bacterium]
MKKLFALVLVVAFVLGSVSVYADDTASGGEKKSVFQVWADWIKGE